MAGHDPATGPVAGHVFEHHRLLGTVIEVLVATNDEDLATVVDDAVVAEISRLEVVFSAFDPDSELCRWRRGEVSDPSSEFAELLGWVLRWHLDSTGRFNPRAGVLTELWAEAALTGVVPADDALAAGVDAISQPCFEIVGGKPVVTGDCSAFNLNAIAKGYIVDQALAAGTALGPSWLCVNAGGDLAHRGSGSVRAGIENPHRPYDNEPPLTTIGISNRALATSGDARRGFRVGEQWFGHVLDPLTGRPVDVVGSISVVAADAMTADVAATVAGVMRPAEAIDYLETLDGVVAGLVIDRDRVQWSTSGWADLVVTGS